MLVVYRKWEGQRGEWVELSSTCVSNTLCTHRERVFKSFRSLTVSFKLDGNQVEQGEGILELILIPPLFASDDEVIEDEDGPSMFVPEAWSHVQVSNLRYC